MNAEQRVEPMTRSAITLSLQSNAIVALLLMAHPNRIVVGLGNARQTWLALCQQSSNPVPMNRQQIESAMASGTPFTLRMADGKEYTVPHRDYIWLPPNASYVIVHEDDGHFTVLPLLTMTGLRSKVMEPGAKEK